jgi:hypothetical protein
MMEGPLITPLLATTLVRGKHVRSFHVHSSGQTGWEASEDDDQQIVRQGRYTDWHRVERVLSLFAREIEELREQGWRQA